MVTLTSGGGAQVTPHHLLDWSLDEAPQTVVHDLIGRTDPDLSVFPARTPEGRLSLLCADAAQAEAVAALHRTGEPVQVEGHPATPDGSLAYVLTAPLARRAAASPGRVLVDVSFRVVQA